MAKTKISPEAPPPDTPPEEAPEVIPEDTPPKEAPKAPPEDGSPGEALVILQAPSLMKFVAVNGNGYKVQYGTVLARPEDVEALIRMWGFSIAQSEPEDKG